MSVWTVGSANTLKVLRLVAPPERREWAAVDWAAVERQVGLRLPADYKELVGVYGAGCFGEYLHLYQPCAAWRELDLVHQVEQGLSSLRFLRDAGALVPYRVEDPADLVPFGRAENGDECYWRRTGVEPDEWTVVVGDARGDRWTEFDGGLAEFVLGVLAASSSIAFNPY
ncbi:SMI1/KNR4 family protein [Wenjunlia tyrosinilytica]|nr:SMI1/KNR4 family protein [Wenjunlia tyrosinilytica]